MSICSSQCPKCDSLSRPFLRLSAQGRERVKRGKFTSWLWSSGSTDISRRGPVRPRVMTNVVEPMARMALENPAGRHTAVEELWPIRGMTSSRRTISNILKERDLIPRSRTHQANYEVNVYHSSKGFVNPLQSRANSTFSSLLAAHLQQFFYAALLSAVLFALVRHLAQDS